MNIEQNEQNQDVFYTELKPKLDRYVNIIYDRMIREGSFQKILNEVDTRYYVYSPMNIGHGLRLCLKIIIEFNEVSYYIILDAINRARNPNSARIQSFFMWSHHRDSENEPFHPHINERTDMMNLIGLAVQRISRTFPLRMCKDKTCYTLLTEHETDYCIECESCMGTTCCSICLDDTIIEKLLHTRCGHTFHHNCFQRINEFEHRLVKCPLCRTQLHSHTGQ